MGLFCAPSLSLGATPPLPPLVTPLYVWNRSTLLPVISAPPLADIRHWNYSSHLVYEQEALLSQTDRETRYIGRNLAAQLPEQVVQQTNESK